MFEAYNVENDLQSLIFHCYLFVSLDINCELFFFGHQLGQIVGETISVVQPPGNVSWQDFGPLWQLGNRTIEKFVATVQGLQELRLLFVDDVLNGFGIFADLWEELS